MRLACSGGLVPYDPTLVDGRVAARIAELGFAGVGAHFGYGLAAEPDDLATDACRRAADVLGTFGVQIPQSWGWDANVMHPDPAVRERGVRRLVGASRQATALGAETVNTGVGSLNGRGGYWPQRENHGPEAVDRVIDTLSRAAPQIAAHGVTLALEGHVATTLSTPEILRDVVEAVDHPAVRANLDPVNFVGDLPSLWGSTKVVERTLAMVGPFASTGHIKDIYAEDRLVVHLSETVIGDGEFDLHTYLRGFEKLLPDGWLVVEHLPAGLVALAMSRLGDILRELGIQPR